MENLDKQMNEELEKKVADLTAHNDETGDGKIDVADLKAQLNRIEAQLDLQDTQNRRILHNQRLQAVVAGVLVIALCVVVGLLWYRTNQAYQEILTTCTQVNEIAATLQESLDTLDSEQLASMMQDLPELTEKLKAIDVDAMNDVLTRLPALMDTVNALQQQINGLADTFSGLTSLGGLASLLGGN